MKSNKVVMLIKKKNCQSQLFNIQDLVIWLFKSLDQNVFQKGHIKNSKAQHKQQTYYLLKAINYQQQNYIVL